MIENKTTIKIVKLNVIMTQRLKIFYGLLGAIVGLCIGTFMKNFSTMEMLSRCDIPISMSTIQLKCKFNELSLFFLPNN